MDAEFPGLVGGGGYYAAAVSGKAAHNDGLPPVFGMVKLFDRSVKRVQVRMDKTGHQ
jgi:hypothetical protein